jgi:hypothetical protein
VILLNEDLFLVLAQVNDALHQTFLREFGDNVPPINSDKVSTLLDTYIESPIAPLIKRRQHEIPYLSNDTAMLREMPSEREVKRRLVFEETTKKSARKPQTTFEYELEEESNDTETEEMQLSSMEYIDIPEEEILKKSSKTRTLSSEKLTKKKKSVRYEMKRTLRHIWFLSLF